MTSGLSVDIPATGIAVYPTNYLIKSLSSLINRSYICAASVSGAVAFSLRLSSWLSLLGIAFVQGSNDVLQQLLVVACGQDRPTVNDCWLAVVVAYAERWFRLFVGHAASLASKVGGVSIHRPPLQPWSTP